MKDIPDDLAGFDPTFDPLAAPRPKYDFAGASGRSNECVWGATAPEGPYAIQEWVNDMRGAGVQRVLGLFSEEDAAVRGPDGTAQGYMGALVQAGLDPNGVSLLDPRSPGSRELVLSFCRDAHAQRQVLCIHCADGETLTSVAMADWLLTDYIGGDNVEEACDLLAARKRLSGVGRKTSPEMLERWIQQGFLDSVDPEYARGLVAAWVARKQAEEKTMGVEIAAPECPEV